MLQRKPRGSHIDIILMILLQKVQQIQKLASDTIVNNIYEHTIYTYIYIFRYIFNMGKRTAGIMATNNTCNNYISHKDVAEKLFTIEQANNRQIHKINCIHGQLE